MEWLTEVFSSLTFFLEDSLNISPKYLPALLDNVSPTLVFYVSVSLAIFLICWASERIRNAPQMGDDKTKLKRSNGFDIAPDDEVTFKSSVSKEEIDAHVAKNTKKFIRIKGDLQVHAHLVVQCNGISMYLLSVPKNSAR